MFISLNINIYTIDIIYLFSIFMYIAILFIIAGIDKERIKAVMGHSSDDMFRHYLHIEDKALENVKRAQENISKKIIGDKVDDIEK